MGSFGEQIKEIAKRNGISLYRIAKDLGIAKESLHRSMMEGANPEWNTIKKVVDYLGYEIKFVKRKNNFKKG